MTILMMMMMWRGFWGYPIVWGNSSQKNREIRQATCSYPHVPFSVGPILDVVSRWVYQMAQVMPAPAFCLLGGVASIKDRTNMTNAIQ